MQGQNSLFARPRRWAFRPLARREKRRDLHDHERRATTPAAERPASLRVAAKIAARFVEGLDRIARYALRPSPAWRAILAATRLAEIMSFDPSKAACPAQTHRTPPKTASGNDPAP